MRIKNNIAAWVFIIAVFYFMASILTVFASTLVDKARGVIVIKDWSAIYRNMYPFENKSEIDNNDISAFTQHNKMMMLQEINNKILKAVNTIKSKITSYATDKMLDYMFFTELAKKYDALISWNIAPMSEYNNIIERPDGHLLGLSKKRDVTQSAKNVIQLADFCSKNNVKFLYVSAPAKLCRYEDADISGKIDFVNQNADEFFEILKLNNINYLDFREILHNEKLNHHDLFFMTDGHWRPESGLWAARHILELMRDKYKYNVNPSILNPEKFKTVTYPKWFLGAQGKKLTLSRADPEDFNLLYPEYKTLINHHDVTKGIDETGDFNIFYDMSLLKERNYYVGSTYNVYQSSVLSRYYNKLAKNKIKILLLKDSFSQVVVPFLTLGIEQLDIMDLRLFTGSVQTYIKNERPDAVMILYNIGMIGMEDDRWIRNIFDMR